MTQQADLDALIVRNIGDILAAKDHADRMLPRLWQEAGGAVVAATPAGWFSYSDFEKEEVWIAKSDWLIQNAEPADADFWLGLDERTAPGRDGEGSWLATFTGSGPEGASLALWLDQSILSPSSWKKLLKGHDALVKVMVDAGFQYDDNDDRRLCVPIFVDREALAKAFEEKDFSAALQPLADAVKVAVAALDTLSQLRDRARAGAK